MLLLSTKKKMFTDLTLLVCYILNVVYNVVSILFIMIYLAVLECITSGSIYYTMKTD